MVPSKLVEPKQALRFAMVWGMRKPAA
jgi:hypothetical protein